jgi:iron complex outermembrane receptor protein
MTGNYLSQSSTRSLRRKLCALAIAPMLCLTLSAAHAQEADAPADAALETVTVTAERFPVDEKETSRLVTVATSEELQQTGADNLIDALRRIGGFAYNALAPLGISHGGMNSSLSIRGLSDGELVLINGVPIQGAAGHAYDLNTIPVDQIDRVEIMKGAASTLYGADAMTGVINIITKKPGEKTGGSASVEFGSEDYNNHSVSVSLPKTTAGFHYQHLGEQTEVSRSFTGKYRYDLDPYDLYSWNLNFNPIEHLFIDYLGSFSSTGFEKHYDSPKKAYEGTDQEQTKHFVDMRYETSSLRLKAFGDYELMEMDEYTDKTAPEDSNKNYNAGVQGDYKFNILDSEITVGGDGIYRAADYNNQYGRHYREDYAAFMQIKRTFLDRLTLTLGAREQFIDGSSGASDYDKFLPTFGVTFKATDAINLFANAGKAFRAPTFNNLYYSSDFLEGNPSLKPEEGWTYEAGVKYDNDLVRLRLAGFYMAFEDKIEIDRSKGYPLTYFNAGDYNSLGVEWDLKLYPFARRTDWSRDLSLYTAGYWADPKAEDVNGENYQVGAKIQSTMGVAYTSDPLVLDLNCQALSMREDALPGYGSFNFSGKYKVWKGYVTFGVDNILDKEIITSGNLSPGQTNNYVYYDLGRVVKGGYQISF